MGIHGLMKLISDHAPDAVRTVPIESLVGRTVAIDASMCLYEFLVAVRIGNDQSYLQSDSGDTTSHLIGFLSRTSRLMEKGIRPVYVFDGKAPTLKNGELAKRKRRKEEARAALAEAQKEGTAEAVTTLQKQVVRVTKEHNDDAKHLLKLMGVPIVEAPCEAEAQCAALCAAGVCYATASGDMDTLTFGSTIQLRHLTKAESKKTPIEEINLPKVLAGFGLDMDQFIDVCVLSGCDYSESVRGIGPVKALSLIKKHGTIEQMVKNLDPKKYPIPEGFLEVLPEIRELFRNHKVLPPAEVQLKWRTPDEAGLLAYLVDEKQFARSRISNAIERIRKGKGLRAQTRLDKFFPAVSPESPSRSKIDQFFMKAPVVSSIPSGNSLKRKRSSTAESPKKSPKKEPLGGINMFDPLADPFAPRKPMSEEKKSETMLSAEESSTKGESEM